MWIYEIGVKFAQNEKNEPHILALLEKIKNLVSNANGTYAESWQTSKNEKSVRIKIDVPNKSVLHELEKNTADIQMLINEAETKDSGTAQHNSDDSEQLPRACESLQDKLSRIENSEATNTNLDDTESTSFVPPSERNSSLNNDEVKTLHQLFGDMITGNVTIGHIGINNRCSKTKEGQKILNKLKLTQIVNRIKYERRKKRLASK